MNLSYIPKILVLSVYIGFSYLTIWNCTITVSSFSAVVSPRRPIVKNHHIEHRVTLSSRQRPPSKTVLCMAVSGPMQCRPIGIGSAAPITRITNMDLEQVVETSDEWIQTRTGIGSRHVLVDASHQNDGDDASSTTTTQESLRDLSVRAAKAALEMAKIDASEIDLVIVCTSSPDDLFGDAPSVASILGCSTNTVAFDLTAACSGFLFGIVTAGQFLTASSAQTALVIGADALSRWVDWEDRNSCILFGDGAGAMILQSTQSKSDATPGVLGYAAHSNGLGYCDLQLGYNGTPRKVSTPGHGTIVTSGSYGKVAMNGKEVYKFATREVPEVLFECLEAAGMTVDQVDWLLLHQANIRIMETVAKRLGMPMEKVITNLNEYGNTSAASIPLALDEAVRSGKVKSGDVIACAGFGAGLSWGAAIFKWS